jgi:hypothetical protein
MFCLSIAVSSPQAAAAPKTKTVKPPKTMLPLKVGEVVIDDAGNLVAQMKLGKQTFEAPIDVSTSAAPPGGDCPILHLALGPIHLDLLGLVVDTSPICLAVDADAGPGNLLGNLLCAVAGLLDQGIPLGAILDPNNGFFTPDEIAAILDGITDLINGALARVTAPSSIVGVSDSAVGQCDILNLSLGPVNLDLLGLIVNLDDCSGGPVTVDIFAEPGPGALLGNLLCQLEGLLDGGVTGNPLAILLNQIADAILALI